MKIQFWDGYLRAHRLFVICGGTVEGIAGWQGVFIAKVEGGQKNKTPPNSELYLLVVLLFEPGCD